MRKLILFVLPVACVLYLSACKNANNTTDNTNADTTTVHTDTVITRTVPDTTGNYQRHQNEVNEFRTSVNRRIDSLKAEINERDKGMNKTSAKAKTDWQKTKADLNRQIDSLQADVNTAGNRAESDWQNFKDKVNRNMDTLQTNWQNWKDRNLNKKK